MTLVLPDSGAGTEADGRRHAPSAVRNAAAILAVLQAEGPKAGRLLEIASGTGQHAAVFAAALPDLAWQPTDHDAGNMVTIAAWAAWAGVPNLQAPMVLDAARVGWSGDWAGQDGVLMVNLLHLIAQAAAKVVLAESAAALAPGGRLMIYGPFLRDGVATSDGDAAFDASLRAQDAAIGYKDLGWVLGRLALAGLTAKVIAMPANNVMLVASREG